MGGAASKNKQGGAPPNLAIQGKGAAKPQPAPPAAAEAAEQPKKAVPARSKPVAPAVKKDDGDAVKKEQERKEAERKKQEQEDLSLEQQMAQQYKVFEAEENRKKQEQQEIDSLDQMDAQKYKAVAKQMEAERKKQEQEDMSLEQQMAQKYKAFEEEQKRKKLQEQEDLSLEQQMAQQYKAFAAQQEQKEAEPDKSAALDEADAMLDMFAPPKKAEPKKDVKKQPPIATIFCPDSGTQEDRNTISEVIDGEIFLTNFRGVERLDEMQSKNIKHIVCVNEQSNEHPDQFNYFNIDTLEDQEDHDATEHFGDVQAFTDKALTSGGAVCFHCAAGISRSATMLIAYLMGSRGMRLRDAFALTYSRRRVTWPNRSFMKQLIAYEGALQAKGVLKGSGPSIDLDTWDQWTRGDMEGQARQLQASLEDRHASLKGGDSAQYQAYLKSVSGGLG